MAQYFDLHVFYSRNNGYSVPIVIEENNPEQSYNDDDIIEYAVSHDLLNAEDSNCVDTVDEISEKEYNDMKGV